MNIKTIVNDATSTRDITGLSPKHLECLANILQACRMGGAMLSEMNPQEAREYFQSFNPGQDLSDEELKLNLDKELEAATYLNEILDAITVA